MDTAPVSPVIQPPLPTAVLGLGIIGAAWARNLHTSGALAATWNRTPQAGALLSRPTAAEAAAVAKLVIVVVADPAAVRSVVEAIVPVLTPAHTVQQSSTIDPQSAQAMAALVRATGARYVEAPFTGSKLAAEARKTVFYLGGQAADLEAIESTLALISEHRLRVGDIAQACTLKLAMNLQIAALAEALIESLTLARHAGLSDDTFFDAMRRNVAWSGLAALKEPKLRAGDFAPQFSHKHMHKDIRLVRGTAPTGALPLADLLDQRFGEGATPYADEDFVALARTLAEKWK